MTALNQYERLEASGIWRETPEAQRRDVIVSFGDATLVLTDPRSDTPLAHWSLPAVTRLNPGQMPALYSPGGDGADEELEVEDDLMISAIEKVHRVIEARRPHPGRLRQGITLAGALAMLAAAVLWLPPAMIRHAAKVAPPAQQSDIGARVLAQIEQTTGTACHRPSADALSGQLAERLLGPGHSLHIVPTALDRALALPGKITVVGDRLVSGQADPEVTAGHVLAAQATAQRDDPLLQALRYAGARASFYLLTTGALPEGALDGYGEVLLTQEPAPPGDEPLLALFSRAGVPSQPYARDLDPTGEATLALIEADPYRTTPPAAPVIEERYWTVLRTICAD